MAVSECNNVLLNQLIVHQGAKDIDPLTRRSKLLEHYLVTAYDCVVVE